MDLCHQSQLAPFRPVVCSCTLVNSPLATNVTGQMKDILTTALGMVIFQGTRSPSTALGMVTAGPDCSMHAVAYDELRNLVL